MNHSAKNSTPTAFHFMGCADSMMSSMSMIMRQPLAV